MIVGVIRIGVMTVGVLSVGIMTLSQTDHHDITEILRPNKIFFYKRKYYFM
jgi:hypothetical protein